MANKMLIDAAHPEETRVVVLRGNRVEEFDFESASKKPLRGNIYLAKVTRVEPSLQAAFIEYGGNRHGFLAFSEIHPDYYQIPVADRQALLDEEARAHREEDDEQRQTAPRRSRRRRHGSQNGQNRRNAASGEGGGEFEQTGADAGEQDGAPEDERGAFEATADHEHEQHDHPDDAEHDHDGESDAHGAVEAAASSESDRGEDATEDKHAHREGPAQPAVAYREPDDHVVGEFEATVGESSATDAEPAPGDDQGADDAVVESRGIEDENTALKNEAGNGHEGEHEDEVVEQLGGDALEDVPYRTPRLRRHYKIQEVIKRRQILLVQVVKEERGNKGAALTTYLSLAGRYSVLMPNTARGGGISRKITDADDRKRLKSIAQELEVPEGMGIILRTAGAARSESEVKRDFEYLLRMWETVRELTLRSSAPMLVYEEGSLIKRAIRDLYSKDIDEVIVAGEEGYREAKDFMRLLMPSHTRNVVSYRDPQPIFAKAGAEAQLDAMFSNHVTLRSGGYIVINQTEALVAIDVNSGRSTREHNIEDTALRTNLEAADEVARQLRLRDLAGLIVVDFIDMEEGRNNRAVERRIKDALKNDRARIQIGRISHFGLLEMSRQRIRTGVLEGSTVLCPHCAGAGTVRSTSSIALHVLRVLEDHLIRSAAYNLIVRTRMEVALYVLNQKRAHLNELESRFGATVTVLGDISLTGTVYHAIERGEPATAVPSLQAKTPALGYAESTDVEEDDVEQDIEAEEDDGAEESADGPAGEQETEGHGQAGGDKRRKRRRRRRGRDREARTDSAMDADVDQPSDAGMETMARIGGDLPPPDQMSDAPAPASAEAVEPSDTEHAAMPATSASEVEPEAVVAEDESPVAEAPRRRRSRRAASRTESPVEQSVVTVQAEEAAPPARRSRRSRARIVEDAEPTLALDVPSADRDVGASTVKTSLPESTMVTDVAAESAVDIVAAPVPNAAPAAVSEAPPQPDRPKRSGWWQRAKATITGE